jgi:dihydroxyacetone kinase-like predicted kinase
VQNGQYIGLRNGVLAVGTTSVEAAAFRLLDDMLATERETVTLYYGEAVTASEAAALAAAIGRRYPAVEVSVYEGGQPHYPYILSAE